MPKLEFEFLDLNNKKQIAQENENYTYRNKEDVLEHHSVDTSQSKLSYITSIHSWKKGILLALIPNLLFMFIIQIIGIDSLSSAFEMQISNILMDNGYASATFFDELSWQGLFLIVQGIPFIFSSSTLGDITYKFFPAVEFGFLILFFGLYMLTSKWIVKPTKDIRKNVAVVIVASIVHAIIAMIVSQSTILEMDSVFVIDVVQFNLFSVFWRSVLLALLMALFAHISVKKNVIHSIQIIKVALVDMVRFIVVTFIFVLIFGEWLTKVLNESAIDFYFEAEYNLFYFIALIFGGSIRNNGLIFPFSTPSGLESSDLRYSSDQYYIFNYLLESIENIIRFISLPSLLCWLVIVIIYAYMLKKTAKKLLNLLNKNFKKTSFIYAITLLGTIMLALYLSKSGTVRYQAAVIWEYDVLQVVLNPVSIVALCLAIIGLLRYFKGYFI